MGKGIFSYKTIIHAQKDEVWRFFSTAENLAKITSFPKVRITSDPETKKGNHIVMELQFFLFTFHWTAIITAVTDDYFIDEAIKVPFPLIAWKHKHHLHAENGVTVMTDTVEYESIIPSSLLKPFFYGMFQSRKKAIQHYFKNQ
ncbi:hypothetical protein [Alkalihalobacillus sp. LMS39]|uniref:SRPBCC family protein n=1 Tax=Alkalihalobacillus sp. LMS39 TaxID=2924032 RepID=UPI001FB3B1C1|nr:hypothetical protein [Alkalihalobacillus sp. LMS39]UOE95974.1 hypothetical protein MM271_10390 [Alkalihalobacillus sp. LMS39]